MDVVKENVCPYVETARSTGVFKPGELSIIGEIIGECGTAPGAEYYLLEDRRSDQIAGFAVFGPLEWTENTWELYWLIVGAVFQGRGVAGHLLRDVESHVLKVHKSAIIVAETSAVDLYAPARSFYSRKGFHESIRIPDYYAPGDGLAVFYKRLRA